MKPKEVLEKWIDCFNKADAYHIAELYATNAVNHQVANEPIIGKESIYKMFVNEFATAKMVVWWKIFLKMANGLSWNGKTLLDFVDADFFM